MIHTLGENCSTEEDFLYLWASLSSCESHSNTFIYLALGKPSITPCSTFRRKSLWSTKMLSFSISVNPRSFIGWVQWGKPVLLWNIIVMMNENKTWLIYSITLYYIILVCTWKVVKEVEQGWFRVIGLIIF